MRSEDIIKALGIIAELANGISKVTSALQDGMTTEELNTFIEEQNELQEKLRQELIRDTE